MSELQKKLLNIQYELRAPKGQYNSFGKYRYRSCEDILEALKPLLVKQGIVLTISDDLVESNGRHYVKACATLMYQDERICVSAFAREEDTKKGMDGSQITGASSSYARKYALNGLFCIDDTKDSDTTNTEDNSLLREGIEAISNAKTIPELAAVWKRYNSLQSDENFEKAKNLKKSALQNGL